VEVWILVLTTEISHAQTVLNTVYPQHRKQDLGGMSDPMGVFESL